MSRRDLCLVGYLPVYFGPQVIEQRRAKEFEPRMSVELTLRRNCEDQGHWSVGTSNGVWRSEQFRSGYYEHAETEIRSQDDQRLPVEGRLGRRISADRQRRQHLGSAEHQGCVGRACWTYGQ